MRHRIKTVSILSVLSPQRMSAERKQTPHVVENPGNGRKAKRGANSSGAKGRGFESTRAYHIPKQPRPSADPSLIHRCGRRLGDGAGILAAGRRKKQEPSDSSGPMTAKTASFTAAIVPETGCGRPLPGDVSVQSPNEPKGIGTAAMPASGLILPRLSRGRFDYIILTARPVRFELLPSRFFSEQRRG